MRLIDADALIERLEKSHSYHARTSREEVLLYRDIRIIGEQPTIDAAPVVHGRWGAGEKCNHKPRRLKHPEKWVICRCSVCDYSNGRRKSNFCPECNLKP